MNNFPIFVPAHLESTRLPRKLLLPSVRHKNKPILYDTIYNLREHFPSDRVIVVSDSEEIAELVTDDWEMCDFVKTGKHSSGSSRIIEAAKTCGLSQDDWLINFQADEVCFPSEQLENFSKSLKNASLSFSKIVGTFLAPIRGSKDLQNPNVVKVVCSWPFVSDIGKAHYFSRSPVPYFTEPYHYSERKKAFQHIGIYFTQLYILKKFSADPEIENLEQLEALMQGVTFLCYLLKDAPIQINTQEDYDAYKKAYSSG